MGDMQLLLLLLSAVVVTAERAAGAMPMEVYFSPGELARIAGYGEEPVSTVVVTGQVTCELCLRPGSDLLTFQLQGAKVVVACAAEGPNNMPTSFVFAATDEFGNFTIHLPSRLHATPSLENACVVNVLQLPPDSACGLRHRPATTYRLRPSAGAATEGVRAYTAGVIRLQHGGTPSGECVQDCR